MRVASWRRKRRSWVTKTIDPAKPSRKSCSHSMASMSRWLVGSSSSSTSGAHTSACASSTRRFMPPDSAAKSASPSSSRRDRVWPTRVSRSQPWPASMRSCARAMASVSPSCAAWWKAASCAPSSPSPAATTSNTLPAASCGTAWVRRATRTPSWRRTSPSSGTMAPSSRRSRVDLPAPLRPTTHTRSPASRVKSMPSSSSGPPTL